MCLIFKKKHPEKGVHDLVVFAAYLVMFVLLSIPLVILAGLTLRGSDFRMDLLLLIDHMEQS
jgi:Ni,Fe-hydrogenase I cytochrome b subunit